MMQKKFLKTLAAITAMVSVLSTGMVAFAAEDYVVQSGDSLKKIAKQSYGDDTKWEVIYEANKDAIKNPRLIYAGQVLHIPDLTDTEDTTATEETTASETETTPTTEETISDTDTVSSPVKNVPVGENPIVTVRDTGTIFYQYTYTDGNWIEVNDGRTGHVAEAVDGYGVTYREYCPGANEIAMKRVADYIAQNPASNFASMLGQYGNQFVMVSSGAGLWDDEGDYEWCFDIVDCEPSDCVYMFVHNDLVEAYGDWESEWFDLFSVVSESISFN